MNITTPKLSKETIKENTIRILKNLIAKNDLDFFEYSFFGNNEKQLRLDEINLTNGKSKESFERITVPLYHDLFYGLSDWVSSEFIKINPHLIKNSNNKEYAYEYVDNIVTTGKIFTCEEWAEIIFDAAKYK